MLPDIIVEATLVLESFDFKPGTHTFTFRLPGRLEYRFPELSNKVYVGFLGYICENIVTSKRILDFIGQTLNGIEYLVWDEESITFDLDKHPEAKKSFDKRVPLIGTKYIDFIGIKEIIIRNSEVELRLKVYTDDFKFQNVFVQAAEKVRQEMNAASTIPSDKKQIFERLMERVKQYPDTLQAHIEGELPKLKETTGKIGGKLWEGIDFLWDAMRDPDVPQEAKFTAIAALLYFVSPIDLISDILPGGYVDDGVVLSLAVKAVKEILVRHKYSISAGDGCDVGTSAEEAATALASGAGDVCGSGTGKTGPKTALLSHETGDA
jgi:uncharacterized membrane protein YkvA (DUF1232 family)